MQRDEKETKKTEQTKQLAAHLFALASCTCLKRVP